MYTEALRKKGERRWSEREGAVKAQKLFSRALVFFTFCPLHPQCHPVSSLPTHGSSKLVVSEPHFRDLLPFLTSFLLNSERWFDNAVRFDRGAIAGGCPFFIFF